MSRFDLSCRVVHCTAAAVLIEDGRTDANDEPIQTWLPLSQVESDDDLETDAFVILSVPEWMAIEKELC